MKKSLRLWVVGAVICAAGISKATSESFEGYADGTAVTNLTGWYTTGEKNGGTNVLAIPRNTAVSNNVSMGGIAWSDFWTVPCPFSPVTGSNNVDTNATAMFFLNPDGYWVTLSGAGGAVTNTWTAVPPTTDAWVHVSIYQNYSNKTWAMFTDDGMDTNLGVVATNLGFINTNASVCACFSVENGGGTNATLVDNVNVTNKLDDTFSGNSDHDTLRDGWELIYLGSLNSATDATTAAFGTTNPVASTTVSNNTVALNFGLGSGYQTILLGSSSPSNFTPTGSTSAGGAFSISNLPAGRQFYQVVSSSLDGSFKGTSTTYAVYTLPANSANSIWLAVPPVATDNKLQGQFGSNLVTALNLAPSADAYPSHGDRITVYLSDGTHSDFVWTVSGWKIYPSLAAPDMTVSRGQGILVTRASSASVRAVFVGKYDASVGVQIIAPADWGMIGWPYDTSITVSNMLPNFPATSELWKNRDGYTRILRDASGSWRYPNGVIADSVTVNLGEAVFVRNRGAAYTNAPAP